MSVKPVIEKVSNRSDFGWRLQYYHSCPSSFCWHYHAEYEIVLKRDFKGTMFVGDHIAEARHNTLLMFGPKLPHTITHDPDFDNENNRIYILWFSHEWISGVIKSLPELEGVKSLLSRSVQGLEFTEELAEKIFPLLQGHQEFSPALAANRLIEVLIVLSETKKVRLLNKYSQPALQENPKELKLVQKVSEFIELNYRNNIQVSDLCNAVHVSESTVYRLFERHFVSSFSNHIKEFRIGKACELLVNSNISIAAIADQVGFSNLSNFNRQFKQCKQMTPKQFRLLFA
ncbi:helix-turn-helix domain-containing protein [Psychromonas ossibalaenae]|uniref:helix-turn-helix domain-containing protein n=1 Tax=Psychromonas ossibalaenae TaxID=444922 RepID=UPI001FE186C9|nr:AraC family transcriptional regulator [Psychromonas ossibalaenae]